MNWKYEFNVYRVNTIKLYLNTMLCLLMVKECQCYANVVLSVYTRVIYSKNTYMVLLGMRVYVIMKWLSSLYFSNTIRMYYVTK